MSISRQFISYILNRNLINKLNVISCIQVPTLRSVGFSFVLPFDFDLENLNFIKVLLFLEYLSGQKCSLIRIGKQLDGRIVKFLTCGVITLRKKNLFNFFNNLQLFMENSRITIGNETKYSSNLKTTKIKMEIDILKVSSHIPLSLRFLNFKFFIEVEFFGTYESVKLLLSGLKIFV